MKASDVAKGLLVGAILGAIILVLNRSLGGDAPLDADVKRAIVGGLIGGGVVALYMPLRRRIKETIGSLK